MKFNKTYKPADHEKDIYQLWMDSHDFSPRGDGHFSVVLPPPNANGNLHMGHALTTAIQDTVVRYHRMQGVSTIYVPGADHAGFETWVVYERKLNSEGKSRFDFNRDELYSQVWDFVESNKTNMSDQLRALGVSVDWNAFTYTLDQRVVRTTYSTFKKLWDDGLIYRGKRLVNFCTKHQTSFSDIEVDYEEKVSPLYYMNYGPFVIATTRPETKFGDTAVAVHPDDDRYKDLVGKKVEVEGLNGVFELLVVADKMVDMEFGTGAVKITPAHDFNDYEVAQRHNLPMVEVIDTDGKMKEAAGKYTGLSVSEARKEVVSDLDAKGLLVKVDEGYKNRVGVCYKCGTVIEPMLKDQWFVEMKTLADRAASSLKDKEIEYYPDSRRKQTINYLEEVRDWNISRQIAWGIPIPAFYNKDDESDWIYNEGVDQETIEVDGKTYIRDPDVFDTWFSSGQWPFVTLDYPEGSSYQKYYPLSLMETGFDIMYQWVARMVVLGLYVTDTVPFEEVYFHGLVLDEKGQKMSKSIGNVISPAELIEEYGSDALRMGLLTGRSAGVNQPFTKDKVISARNFANKVWNISRYLGGKEEFGFKDEIPDPRSAIDHWMIWRISDVIKQLDALMSKYRLSEAYELIYHLVWDDFADWYIESSKVNFNQSVINYAFNSLLKIIHPFAPFITETIWQSTYHKDSNLINQAYPKAQSFVEESANDFLQLKDLISDIREVQSQLGKKNNRVFYAVNPLISNNEDLIVSMAKVSECVEVDRENKEGLRLINNTFDTWLDIDQETIADYKNKLEIKAEKLKKQQSIISARLNNQDYIKSAPKELVEQSQEDARKLEKQIKAIISQIDKLK